MSAGAYNITIIEGEDTALPVICADDAGSPINLTGYTSSLKVRKSPALDDVFLSLTEVDGLDVGTVDGDITINIKKEQIAAIGAPFYGKYDLFITSSGGDSRCILTGEFNIERANTR